MKFLNRTRDSRKPQGESSASAKSDVVGKKRNPRVLLTALAKTSGNAAVTDYKASYERVLLVPFVAGSTLSVMREGLFAHAFQMRGARVSMVLCDELLPACDARTVETGPHDCRGCYAIGKELYSAFGLDSLTLGSYLSRELKDRLSELAQTCDVKEIFSYQYRDIDIGVHVFSSVHRHFYAAHIDLSQQRYETLARRYLCSALLVTEACALMLEDVKPDKVLTSHGLYVSWGPIFDLCRKDGIAIDTFGGSYRRNTVRFYHEKAPRPRPHDGWNAETAESLTSEENAQLDEYLESRGTLKNDYFSYHRNPSKEATREHRWLESRKENGGMIFGMFPNIAWDSVLLTTKASFTSILDWVGDTIDWFGEHPEHSLILKAHPAEIGHVEKTPLEWRIGTYIHQRYGALPENIKYVAPNVEVNPLSLYALIDCGLVYLSTVGMELAGMGIPVITAGAGAHYAGQGFTLDAGCREDYSRLLSEMASQKIAFSPDVEMARKYMYFSFFRDAIELDILDVKGWDPGALNIADLAALAPGKNESVDKICNGVLQGAPYIFRPEPNV